MDCYDDFKSYIENSLGEGEVMLWCATVKELAILGRTKKQRIRKKYTDRITRRAASVA